MKLSDQHGNADAEVANARSEIARGERFEFGRNWQKYVRNLDENQIDEAKESLVSALGDENFGGKSFLDIGSGSGLFSLAARQLGARVHSVDYDENSVDCAIQLRKKYFPDDENWAIDCGSVLDVEYMESLGKFDIVYSWGVLHQTGDMWSALEIAGKSVADDGKIFISIYNDQNRTSDRWRRVKKFYNSGLTGRIIVTSVGVSYFALKRVKGWIGATLRRQAPKKRRRGMAFLSDAIDWLGGYPHEVAKPEAIFEFYRDRGFQLLHMTTVGGGLGCNEYVFQRVSGN